MSKPEFRNEDIITAQRSGKNSPIVKQVTLVFVQNFMNESYTGAGFIQYCQSMMNDLSRLLPGENVTLSPVLVTQDLLSDLPYITPDTPSFTQLIRQRVNAQEEAQIILSHAAQEAGYFDTKETVHYTMQQGSVERLLQKMAEAPQDLLIICGLGQAEGSLGHSQFSLNLVAHAPTSTLLMRLPFHRKHTPLQIIFGIDSSEATLNAARKLGKTLSLEQAELILTMVQSPIYQDNAIWAPYVNQTVLDEAQEANSAMVIEMIQDILSSECDLDAAQLKSQRLIGSPATELGHFAATENPDLIVVGSHNRKGILSWIMGSVSSQLLHWDKHNLLIMR